MSEFYFRIFCCCSFNPYNAAIVKEALFSDTIIGRIEIGEEFKTSLFN
jgi:hypothetical protein